MGEQDLPSLHVYYDSHTHLVKCISQGGCWYIDCEKVFCPIEEEDAKKSYIQANSKAVELGPNQGEEQEDEVEVDIREKERNKILNHKIKDAKKAKEKA